MFDLRFLLIPKPSKSKKKAVAHDAFISYASKDKAVADVVCATLEEQNIRCWIAPRDILAGVSYGEALIDALNASRIMVLVFSASSNNSPQVLREVERTVSKGIPIIPFRIEDVPLSKAMEYFISSPHWLDALTLPMEKHLRNLAETVKALLARTHSSPPDKQLPPPVRETRTPGIKSIGNATSQNRWKLEHEMASPPAPTRQTTLLLLKPASGPEIRLCTRAQAQIGRARDCDLVARIIGEDGKESRDASLRISRHHACLEWQDDLPVLHDRGYYPDEACWRPSATGIWVDGHPIPSGGTQALVPGHDYEVCLGASDEKKHSAFNLSMRAYLLCDIQLPREENLSAGSPATSVACLLVRTKGPRRAGVFVFLRQAVCLGWVDPRCGHSCVCRHENGLQLFDGHDRTLLAPGRSLRAGQLDFQVLDPNDRLANRIES